MNGSTNVQISAIATFVSVAVLWLAGYFFPDLMSTAPDMLGELFTGAMIVGFGLYFNHDAGIKQLPGTGSSVRSPLIVSLLAALLVLGMLAGCGTQRPQIDSIADGIAVTAADVETVAQTVKQLCQNKAPGGPCAPGALISTNAKERIKASLQTALNSLSVADIALSADDTIEASDRLARTNALLAILRAEIARLQN